MARPEKDRWELYDVRSDPQEQHPLGPEHRERLDRLRERLITYQQTMDRLAETRGSAPMAELSAQDEELLEWLGYLRRTEEGE